MRIVLSESDLYAPNYFVARRRFREAALDVHAQLDAYPVGEFAPTGEALSTEVAWLGAREPNRSVVVTSGLHGVEGFFGSAVQLAWLRAVAMGEAEVPPRTTVILVHAVNPFGFAWCRRVDEQNVDLNRNFVDLDVGEEYTGRPPRYELVHKLMNPTGPSSMFSSVVPFRIRAGLAIKRYGVQALSTAIASGQYAHPRAMFFGGVEPSRSTRFMQERFWLWTRGAGDVVHLDLHTGLGPYADYQLFIEPPCLPHLLWFRKHFDQHRVVSVGDRGVYAARGVMGAWLARHAEGCRYRFACAEFGTYQTIRVLAALRAENRAHHYAPSRSPVQMRAKRELVECFCPRNKYWRQKSVKRGVKVIEQALSAVQYVA